MHDVVIIGGGAIGCATALHLLKSEPGLDVQVLEPDPAYTHAASTRASGGVRQLFTRPENIQLSQYTLEIIDAWPEFLGTRPTELAWKPNGYLFIAPPGGTGALERDLTTQLDHGVDAEWLEPAELAGRYPWLATGDLGPAVLSRRDGWLDPHAFLHGMRAAAAHLGAAFQSERVSSLRVAGTRVTGLELASGRRLDAETVVNAAGTDAPRLAAQAGMPVPVEPLPRHEHYVEVPIDNAGMPFIKDPAGLAVRPEGPGLSAGLVDFDRAASFDLPREPHYFEEVVWPALAHRIPALDALRLRSTWSGHYDQNRMDGNLIIGNWPGHVDNLYLATGLSGHGLMHAPGIGRAITELILDGGYATLDLSRMGYQRVHDEAPYPELGIR